MVTLNHSHCNKHALLKPQAGTGILHIIMHMLTLTSTAHLITHLISSIPILLGLTGHAHDHSLGELAVASFMLNALLHLVMAIMVVVYEKVK
jgi:hypothetical protein